MAEDFFNYGFNQSLPPVSSSPASTYQSKGASSVPDPFTIGATVVGGGLGLLSGILGKDDQQIQGLTLPPELEFELLDYSEKSLSQIESEYERVKKANAAFQDKIKALEGVLNASIPGDGALRRIRDANLRIAEAMGGDARQLAKSGYLDPDDIEDLESLKALESQDFEDPRITNQLADERAKLEQQLARDGASPAAIAQALSEFDRDAKATIFGVSNDLRQQQAGLISNRIGLKASLRQSNLQRAMAAFGATGEVLDRSANLAGQSFTLASAGLAAQNQEAQFRAFLRDEGMRQFERLGEFDFSQRARRALEAGEIGPGQITSGNSTLDQTPQALRDMTQQQLFDLQSGAARQLQPGAFRSQYGFDSSQIELELVRRRQSGRM